MVAAELYKGQKHCFAAKDGSMCRNVLLKAVALFVLEMNGLALRFKKWW